MKKLEIGDKVRFLNTTGGGVVKKFLDRQLVLVEDEIGFDVPVLISECVVISSGEKEKIEAKSDIIEDAPAQVVIEKSTEVHETIEGEKITTCLVFLPMDEKNISQTSYESYFVNDSNYYLFVNYISRENSAWKNRFNGLIEPNTQIFIEEFDKSMLNEIENICVQFVAFKHNKSYSFKNPVSVELMIDTVKFYKYHTFTENDYFDEKALTYYITRDNVPMKEMLVSAGDIERAMREKEFSEQRPRRQQITKKPENKVLEVDLHINELLDTTTGLSNSDMLEYQLKKFNEVMQENLKNRNKKIVFIHGKGDGVLKKALLDELRLKYKKCYVQDASFKEYGFGATMVTIK